MKKIMMAIIYAAFTSTSFAYYNSEQGRWLNRDPISENGGINLYGFAENDPINSTDMLGLRVDTSTDASACTITLTLNITVYAQNKSESEKLNLHTAAERIQRQIESAWNGFKSGCCDVNVIANVSADLDSTTWWGVHDDNEISLTSNPRYRSWVWATGNGGHWSATDPDPVVFAHEAGHLMGLPDDYKDNKDGISIANKGHEDHLMGTGDHVDQHEINDILDKQKVKCPCGDGK